MERKYESKEKAMDVAKNAVYLAWQACGGPLRMGFFRDRGHQDKEAVWKQAYDQGDYSMRHGGPESVDCDYVFGRMMKLYFTVEGDTIKHSDGKPRSDYQAWCGKYPTYDELFSAAESA